MPPTDEDGEPLPTTPGADETIVDGQPDLTSPAGGEPQQKIYVDGVGATIIAERVEYLDENGKLVTESLRDFTKKALKKRFASLDDFLGAGSGGPQAGDHRGTGGRGPAARSASPRSGQGPRPLRPHLPRRLRRQPLTRRERAENVRKRDVFTKYGPQARAVLDALLAKYADEGVLNLDDANVLQIPPFNRIGTPVELISAFGGTARLRAGRPRAASPPSIRRVA